MKEYTAGVYAVQNLVTGRAYIGASIRIPGHWGDMRAKLRRGVWKNRLLQDDWNIYGEDAFSLVILELASTLTALDSMLDRWLSMCDPDRLYILHKGELNRIRRLVAAA